MFKDMAIIKRITLLSSFSMLAIIIILILSLYSLSEMNDNFNNVIEEDATKALLSKDIKVNLLEMHRAEKNLILSLTQKEMRDYNNNFLQAQKEIEKNIVDLRILIDSQNLSKLEAIKTLYDRYSAVYDDIYNLTTQNSNQKAKTLLRIDARDKIKRVDALTDELALIINNEMLEVVLNKNKNKNKNKNTKGIESKLKALTLISSIESNILKSVRDAGRSILLLDSNEIKKMAERSNHHLLKVQTETKKLRAITDKDKNIKIDQIIIALRAYDKVQSQVMNLTIQNSNQKALELSTTKSKEYVVKSRALISEIVNYNDEIMHEATLLSDVRYKEVFYRLLIVFSTIYIFIIYFYFITYKHIKVKLDTVYTKIEIIKTGKFEDDNEESTTRDELGLIVSALTDAIKRLKINSIEFKSQSWIKEGVNTLNKKLGTETEAVEVSQKSIDFLCTYLNAGIGSLYIFDEKTEMLNQYANYAYVQREEIRKNFALGEGTVGQVARQKSPIQLRNIKRTQLLIDTGTTSEPPLNTYTFPLIYQNKLFGVIELGSSEIFDANAAEFFSLANEIIATALSSSKQSKKVQVLLQETQSKNKNIEEASIQMQEQQQQLEEANAQMEEQQKQLEEKNIILEESQVALDKRAKDLEVSGKYKSEFLANMSHELRTPLNSIILLSDMLQDDLFGHLDKEEIKKASIIHNSGNELLRLINDVLDLSKVEAGKMDIIVDAFQSSAFKEELGTEFDHQATEKNLEFITSDNYKGIIYSDRDRLAQVVRNLISNALKFTKQGTISLDIQNAENNNIKISVSDTGIGISNDKLNSIFEAFQQADGGTSRTYGGTGLGLSISKELAHMLGGKISVTSKINEGSTFSLIIPNMNDNTDNIQEVGNLQKVNINDIDLSGSKILVADDDIRNIYVLSEVLGSKGAETITANNGKEAVETLDAHSDIDVILMDIMMPVMDGYEATKIIKSNAKTKNIPIIAVTSKAMAEDQVKALEAGCDDYITKPLKMDVLLGIVKSWIK